MSYPGYRTFITIWVGQSLSRVGTAMTRFALLIWAYLSANRPILLGCRQAIWQLNFDPVAQGRVFSVDSMLRLALNPLGYLLAGYRADFLLEPAMRPDGALADVFGPLVGTGPGAGMAVMFIDTATLGGLMSLAAYLFPAARNIESTLPDHDFRPEGSVLAVESAGRKT